MTADTSIEPAVPARARGDAGAVGLVVLLLIVESALVLLATRGRCPGCALAAHLLTVAALATWVRLNVRKIPDPRAHTLLCVTTPFLGPVAAAGVVLQIVCSRIFAPLAMPLKEWYARLFPEAVSDPARSLHARLDREVAEFRFPSGPAPFAEVMLAGSQEQKQALLTMACRDFRAVFAPMLQLALHDENSAVRVQAAATIARIEEQFRRTIEDLSATLRERPDDTAARLSLARTYDDHSAIGWLDPRRQQESRAKALDLYAGHLRERPDDETAMLAVGRMHLRAGHASDAVRWFEDGIAGGHATPGMLFGRLEGLFHLGRFDELHRILAQDYDRLAGSGELSADALRTLESWHAQALTGPREERRP